MPYAGFAFTSAALDFLETLPPKLRKQVIKKAKGLHTNPYPQGSKKLHGVVTEDGDPIYRERSGDYRILYVVRSSPDEILILDIDHRKDVYRMPNIKAEAADQVNEANFDAIMSKAPCVADPQFDDGGPASRLSSYPPRKRGKS